MSDPTPDFTPDPTPCPEREETLALHAGGDLPEVEARELERHLASCADCRAFLSEMEESLRVFAGLTATPPAGALSEVHRGVMEQVERERAEGGSPRWRSTVRSTVRWAAAAVLLLLGAALLWRLGTDRDPNRPEPPDPVIAARPDEPREQPRIQPEREPRDEPARPAVPKAPPTRTETPQPAVVPEQEPDPVPKHPPRSVPQPTPEPETQRAGLEDRPDLKIQLVSDDPGIVIYWLVETEKPQDATSTS